MKKTDIPPIWHKVMDTFDCFTISQLAEKFNIPRTIMANWVKNRYGKKGPRQEHIFSLFRELQKANPQLYAEFRAYVYAHYQPSKKIPSTVELPPCFPKIFAKLGIPNIAAIPAVLGYSLQMKRNSSPLINHMVGYNFIKRYKEGRTNLFRGVAGRILEILVAMDEKELAWEFLQTAYQYMKENGKGVL